jgi:hypothetical protein
MIKIGIVGSREYINKQRVIEIVDQCIQKYGKELMIISGGARGADTLGKEVALEKELLYKEYNPAHEAWNQWSGKPKEFYGKAFSKGHYFERNTFIAQDIDILFAFIPINHQSNGTQDTIKKAESLGKIVFIIN